MAGRGGFVFFSRRDGAVFFFFPRRDGAVVFFSEAGRGGLFFFSTGRDGAVFFFFFREPGRDGCFWRWHFFWRDGAKSLHRPASRPCKALVNSLHRHPFDPRCNVTVLVFLSKLSCNPSFRCLLFLCDIAAWRLKEMYSILVDSSPTSYCLPKPLFLYLLSYISTILLTMNYSVYVLL